MERKPIGSIDGQVRLIVGILIIVSVALTLLASQTWLIMTAFLGFALVVASFTGVCPMEYFVSKCPWNQPERTRIPS